MERGLELIGYTVCSRGGGGGKNLERHGDKYKVWRDGWGLFVQGLQMPR